MRSAEWRKRWRSAALALICASGLICANPAAVTAEENSSAAESAASSASAAESGAQSAAPAQEIGAQPASAANYDAALSNLVDGWPQMGDINEETGYLIDADNHGVMYSLNANTMRYPASTTKIMTALLTIENCSLDDTITMTSTGTQMAVGGSTNAGTVDGEQFTVEQALSMLMLKSANDIANQLAEHVGGSMEGFVDMMNARAAEIGCKDTHFNNPSGMPDSEHYTTAHDMALIMSECIKNETFLRIAGASSCTIPATNMTSTDRVYVNHNKLLVKDSEFYYEYCIAGKTGYTDAAWRTYVGAAKKDDRTLICVLMRGPDKTDFLDAAKLFEYGFNEFEKRKITGGSVNLPPDISEDALTSETEGADGGLQKVTFLYNNLPVGSAGMTEKEYASYIEALRGESGTPGETVSAADTAEAGTESGVPAAKTNVKKKDRGALVLLILIAAAVAGGGYAYSRYLEKERRRRRRRRRRRE